MSRSIDVKGQPHRHHLQERIGDLLDHFYETIGKHHHAISGHVAADFAPATDIAQSEIGLEIEMELAGMDADDVEIAVRDGVLTVRGEKKTESEEKGRDYVRRERMVGRFERAVALADDLDPDKAEASFDKGVLKISVPLKPEAERSPRKIPIRAG